ncbi:MAG: F0F1 ATP synthase subunit delta [Spirochaeta sp.]
MEINWFILITQIVNFLILVLLLRHFLFKKILSMMDERREDLEQKFSEADEQKAEAERKETEFNRKNEELQNKREELFQSVRDEADEKKQQLLEQARSQVEDEKRQWFDSLREQKKEFLKDLRVKTGRRTYEILAKILRDLADAEIESQIAAVFVRRVRNPGEDEREALQALAKDTPQEVVVYSSFELPPELQDEITAALQQAAEVDFRVEFERREQVIGGIEVSADGRKIAWSIADYLNSLQEDVEAALQQEPDGEESHEREQD